MMRLRRSRANSLRSRVFLKQSRQGVVLTLKPQTLNLKPVTKSPQVLLNKQLSCSLSSLKGVIYRSIIGLMKGDTGN